MRFLLEHIERRPLTEREFKKNKWYSLSLADLRAEPELAKGKNGWYYRKIGGSRHLKAMIGKVRA